LLWLYQRVFFGTVTNPKNENLKDLTPREVATFVPLVIMALWIGLYPKPFLQILEQPVNHLVATMHQEPGQAPATAAKVGAPLPGVGRSGGFEPAPANIARLNSSSVSTAKKGTN
jgi:NADH-quinone oxidoreductase subunit M